MDSLKEDDSAAQTPPTGVSRGGPSILYFVDNIPQDAEKLKFEVISHFQKRKRFKGGEVVEKEYQVLGPHSALLLFENAQEVSELQTVSHHIKDQEVELHPLVKEHVIIEIGGPLFFQTLMSSREMAQLLVDEELLVQKRSNNYAISGNWISVQNFRERFQQFMIAQLKKQSRKDFAGLFSSSSETTESIADPKTEVPEDTSSGGSISAKGSSLNPDVLALMQKTGAYQHPALSYDLQAATINIDHDDPVEKEKIKEELFAVYRNIMMGGKLKEHAFPVEDLQQANAMVEECMKAFNHTHFRYDSEKKEIKCLSTDARQMQNVRRRLNSMKKDPKVKSVSIDLPKKSRKVTIKLGDIIEEEVDIIVNAANDRLMHAGGVAAAIDKASYGAVQKESSRIVEQTGTLPTGQAVITSSGGKLKCKFVVHAVGPIASQHRNNCGPLLHNACVNSMLLAQHNKAKSISFPPISSGIFGVSKELVANIMLSTLCSYTCDDPELLNDVRIVIIDEATFDVFLKLFHKEKENLELLQHTNPAISKPATYPSMQPRISPLLAAQKSLVSIDVPKVARRVTIKLGDIVQEQVDVIVNAANMHLSHFEGVAAAIDKASDGAMQRVCTDIISSRKLIPTGNAVATAAGGSLKCKLVIHAVGPIATMHKEQCATLLTKACINAMNVAKNFEATSIAFPPISSGDCGVPNEIVANVMLSTLCSYKCNVPTLLTDVRIVIIDKPTFEVFLNVLQGQQQSLGGSATTPEILKPPTFQYDQSGGNFSPGNAMIFPGHVRPVSYSHAVAQQPPEMKGRTSDSFDALPTRLPHPNSHNLPETQDKHAKSFPGINEPQRDSDSTQEDFNNNSTQPQSIISSSDISGAANASEESSRSHQSGDNNNKVDKHSEDVPIDRFKDSSNKENSDFVIVEKPSGFDSSVDPESTNKNPSDNTKLPVTGDPSGSTKSLEESSGEQHGPHPEAAKDNPGLRPERKNVSLTFHKKHLPSAATDVQTSLQSSEIKDKSKEKKNEDCPICFDKLKDKAVTAVTTCKHCKQAFCKGCLDEALQHKPYCPTCTVPLRKVTGNQPLNATMTTQTYPHQKLPGYEKYGTIEIHYDIPNGKQGKEHPNPGEMFHGTSRIAYLPNSPKGRKVVQLLRKAFEARLIFTIGTSHTSGKTNAVVWNDIHHKTSTHGGPTNYGYPDSTYLNRVLEELAAKGIKE